MFSSNDSGEKNDAAILVGDVIDADAGTRKYELYQPWIPNIFLIQGQHSPYSLIVHQINKEPDPHEIKAVFDFDAQQYNLRTLEILDEDRKIIVTNNQPQSSLENEE